MNFKTISLQFFAATLLALVLTGSAFSQTEKKSAQGILIDNSGSLRSQFSLVVQLSKGIVQQTTGRGPISLFAFNSPPKNTGPLIPVLGIEQSQDKNSLDQYIESIFVVPGQTALADGIGVIGAHLNAKVSADKEAYAEKVIFLVTDGEDRINNLGQKDLINFLKANSIKVYAVGLVQVLESDGGIIGKSKKEKAITFLNKLTKETGGRAVIPKSKKIDVEAVLTELFAK